VLDNVELYRSSVSFGSVHSQIEMPALHSHASIPEEERTLPAALIRLSVGVEDVVSAPWVKQDSGPTLMLALVE
jgi:cystathionine beta-lyase/cystathionine gamma-synthase